MYVKLDSWHIIEEDAVSTICGRETPLDAEISDRLPLDEKSCETCLRLAAHESNPDAD